ncbi:hypothetical protein Pmani_004239 [Petrolisthes manimaculis]|uniref:Uncharacterized protein n=1 Tax=Petrolisthes manimaculis TaxID=1843537 RepID=A0AAE1UHM5_9EUCA|nr:hypothetical protein Pmani_004239 [Petrolisthes manimaculis]
MSQLPTTHPDVLSKFMVGKFSVQLGSINPFGRIPVDQAIEETVNKDTQTAGGTKGFSLKSGTVSKYYITQEYRSRYLRQLREMTGGSSSRLTYPDLQTERKKKYERDVEALTDLMENTWLNPMCPDEEDLVSLSTDIVSPPEVNRDLLRAHTVGEAAYQEFKVRLDEDQQEKLHSKLKKRGLKTFTNLSVKQGNSVNELRYQLFCAKRGAESSQLPPSRDCLFLHAQRANFQAAIWRRCLEPKPNMPSPIEHGWAEEDGKLNILWMRSVPAPEVVLELLSCKCSRVCKLSDCKCLVNGLACNDMYKLRTCTN